MLQDLVGLITRAGKAAGSEYKLAQMLGVPQTNISMWKSGVRTCSPEDRARIAAIAGEDATQELIRAVLEKHQGTKKGDQLFAILGKPLRQTGAALHTAVLAAISAVCLMMAPTPSEAATSHNV